MVISNLLELQIPYEEAALKSQIAVSEQDSSANVMLHLEEIGVRNSQKSNSDCDQTVQQPDQVYFCHLYG